MRLTAVKVVSVPVGGFLLGAFAGIAWAWACTDIQPATTAEYALHGSAIGQSWTITAAAQATQWLDYQVHSPSSGFWRPLLVKAEAVAPLVVLRGRTVGGLLLASAPLWLLVWTMGKAVAARRYKTAEGPNSFKAQLALSAGFSGLVALGALIATPLVMPTFAVGIIALIVVLSAAFQLRANSPLTI